MARGPGQGEVRLGKGRDGERGQGSAPHGVDVRERVRGGDGPEVLGIVDDRGEEVHGLHEGGALVEAKDAGIVARRLVDENAGIVGAGQPAQHLGELGGPSLLAQPAQATRSVSRRIRWRSSVTLGSLPGLAYYLV